MNHKTSVTCPNCPIQLFSVVNMKNVYSLLLISLTLAIVSCATVPKTPTLPVNPIMSNMTFASEVNLPDIPSAPNVKSLRIQKQSYVGFRYMPTSHTEKIGGDIICSITPLDIPPLKSTSIDGRPFVLNPVGFTMYLIVRNKSDHIIKLEKSILQFEDSQGNEFPIALTGGWIESTSMFIDSIGKQYESRVNDILNEYKAQNMDLAHKLMPQINAIKDDNNRKLKQYSDFIMSEYEPRFAQYKKEVEQYNRMNLNVKQITGAYLQEPIEIEIDQHSTPDSLIQNKQYECSRANLALDQALNEVEKKIDRNAQAARGQMLAAIKKKQQEWKDILNSVQTNATKVVRGDGVFDPIVIPPGKHRTLLIPGISGIKEWPNILKLVLYDLPSETDIAGNVTKRLNLSFDLHKEEIDVFSLSE